MEQAAQVITGGELFPCDIGRFNEDYFVYVAAFGIFTDVSYQTSQDMKNMLGHAAYLLEGMKRLGNWKSSHLRIESEEYSGEGDFVFGMITNSDSIGGFRGLAGHNVELDDGLFEVLLVHTPQNLIEWQEAIGAVLLKDENSERIEKFKTRRMRITSEEPVAWTRDGEDGGSHTCVEVENLQEEIEFLVEPVPEAAEAGDVAHVQ
jgi:diacylglycerol kinase family enzyme